MPILVIFGLVLSVGIVYIYMVGAGSCWNWKVNGIGEVEEEEKGLMSGIILSNWAKFKSGLAKSEQ